MGKGTRKERRESERGQKKLEDLKEHKGLSKYQRKKLAQEGVVLDFTEERDQP